MRSLRLLADRPLDRGDCAKAFWPTHRAVEKWVTRFPRAISAASCLFGILSIRYSRLGVEVLESHACSR